MVAFVIALLLYTISLISLLSVLTYTKCSFSRGGFTYPAFLRKIGIFSLTWGKRSTRRGFPNFGMSG
jgi:hypothetical protein